MPFLPFSFLFSDNRHFAGRGQLDNGAGFVARGVALAGETYVIHGVDDGGTDICECLGRGLTTDIGRSADYGFLEAVT
jgi:hypothetical protein